MFRINKDYKLPYLKRVMPEGTLVNVIKNYENRTGEDAGKVVVRVVSVPRKTDHELVVESETAYAVNETLLEIN